MVESLLGTWKSYIKTNPVSIYSCIWIKQLIILEGFLVRVSGGETGEPEVQRGWVWGGCELAGHWQLGFPALRRLPVLGDTDPPNSGLVAVRAVHMGWAEVSWVPLEGFRTRASIPGATSAGWPMLAANTQWSSSVSPPCLRGATEEPLGWLSGSFLLSPFISMVASGPKPRE